MRVMTWASGILISFDMIHRSLLLVKPDAPLQKAVLSALAISLSVLYLGVVCVWPPNWRSRWFYYFMIGYASSTIIVSSLNLAGVLQNRSQAAVSISYLAIDGLVIGMSLLLQVIRSQVHSYYQKHYA
jgi:hypothetical protein